MRYAIEWRVSAGEVELGETRVAVQTWRPVPAHFGLAVPSLEQALTTAKQFAKRPAEPVVRVTRAADGLVLAVFTPETNRWM